MLFFTSELYNHDNVFLNYLLGLYDRNIIKCMIDPKEFDMYYFDSKTEYNLLKYAGLTTSFFNVPDGHYFLTYKHERLNNFNDYLYCHISNNYIDKIFLDENQIKNIRNMINFECDKHISVFNLVCSDLEPLVYSLYSDSAEDIMQHYIDEDYEWIENYDKNLLNQIKRGESKYISKVLSIVENELEENEDMEYIME